MLGFPRGKSRNDVEIMMIYIIHTYMYIIVHHMLIVTLQKNKINALIGWTTKKVHWLLVIIKMKLSKGFTEGNYIVFNCFLKAVYLTKRRTSPAALTCFSFMAMFLQPTECSFSPLFSFNDTLETKSIQISRNMWLRTGRNE